MTTDDRVMTLFERANPVPDIDDVAPMRASSYLVELERRSSTMTITATKPEAPEQQPRRRTWLMAAAAVAALALIAGLVFAGSRADEDPVPADQPEPTVPVEEPEAEAEPDDGEPPAEPEAETEPETGADDGAEEAEPPAEPEPETAPGEPFPAAVSPVSADRYTTPALGMDATFELPDGLLLISNRAGNVTLIGGYDGTYLPENGVAVNLNRWAGWSTRDEAVLTAPTASIDPYDVDAWVASNDIIVLSDEVREVAGRTARVFDVQVDPDSTVQATTYPNGPGCFPGWEPCFHMGAIANDDGQRTDWVSAKRITRYYLLEIEGSEPLLVSVGAPPGSDFFDEIESTVIASLELGPDAPPLDG